MKRIIYSLLIGVMGIGVVSAQDVGGKTLISQSRTTAANIGKCDIEIKYHSPSVNNRKIFGGIVPFDFVVDGKEFHEGEWLSINGTTGNIIEGKGTAEMAKH